MNLPDWHFIDSGLCCGLENMERDEDLAFELLRGSGAPTVRVYGWSPWAISLGHHQNEQELDLQRCREDGVDVVRRPTGGRAILHSEELTYCVVMEEENGDVLETYNRIGAALLNGLRLFGVEASLEKSQPRFAGLYRHPSSIPCFSSSARYEIVHKGRKLVGSAQRRYHQNGRTVVLQHGSLLCGPAHERLATYLSNPDHDVRKVVGRTLRMNTVSLKEITGEEVNRDVLVRSIREGFERSWGIKFRLDEYVSARRTGHG